MRSRIVLGLLLCSFGATARADPPALVTSWGSPGSGTGQFSEPQGFGLDPSGHVFVADAGNLRIQEFSNDGMFLTSLSDPLPGTGQYLDVVCDASGTLYTVVDNTIQIYDSGLHFLRAWPLPGMGGPLALDPTGQVLYVLTGNQIASYTTDGTFLTTWTIGPGTPALNTGFAVGRSSAVYVVAPPAAHTTPHLRKFSAMGSLLAEWPGQFDASSGTTPPLAAVTVDDSEHVFVTDGIGRVQVFSSEGDFITMWTAVGSPPFTLTDIAIDHAGDVFVLDFLHDRVQKYAPLATTPVRILTWGDLKKRYR